MAQTATRRRNGNAPKQPASTRPKPCAKSVASETLEAGATIIRAAAARAASTGHDAVEKTAHKWLPIQRSVDVAVPIRASWEWMGLESLPEGVHTVVDIGHDGDELFGCTSGPRPSGTETRTKGVLEGGKEKLFGDDDDSSRRGGTGNPSRTTGARSGSGSRARTTTRGRS